ncbi:acyl-CoA thioesterase-like protein [Phanerochaete sordida]|uniref:Acyl-CoA thioesterase-like protein n=1 Tax=Phanerochaete sordida TaxID=48140 RepID=A0A9P3GSY1_9APHY|nr:acyl-CoA thioesterase-like protein [Phanerochaete sordida]
MDALLCVSTGTWSTVPSTLCALKCASFLQMKSALSWFESLRLRSAPAAHDMPTHTLSPRSKADSYCEQQLCFARAQALFKAYINTRDRIRTGKRMEHLNSLASSIAYKCMLGPVECIAASATLSFYLVTASVDRLSSQSVYVGRSLIYVAVRIEALNSDGPDETVMLGAYAVCRARPLADCSPGRFCMVCRDSKTHGDSTFRSTTRTSSLIFCPRRIVMNLLPPRAWPL